MADWGSSVRRDLYRFMLVDPFTLAEIKPIECEQSNGSLSFAYYTDNKSQASLTIVGDDIDDAHGKMVRVYHRTTCDGDDVEECLGTFFIDSIDVKAAYGIVRGSASCYGPLWRLSKDVLLNDFAFIAGRPKVDSIREIVSSVGGAVVIGDGVTEGDVHEDGGYIEMGTSVYDAVNQIAGSMGCRVDGYETGEVFVEKYVDPRERPVTYEFVESEACTATRGLEIGANGLHPVNRVKLYYSREHSNGDGFPRSDSYTATLDPANQFSYERTGTWRTRIVKLDGPCSHDELKAKAERYLEENSGADVYLTIEHVGVPGLRKGQVVRYCNRSDLGDTIDVDGMIVEMSPKLGPLFRCTSKIKVVRWR